MNKIFEHILVPYNGCPGSQKAFKKSVELAKVTQSKITIFTCLEERSTFGFFKTKTSKGEFKKRDQSRRKTTPEIGRIYESYDISCGSKIVKNKLVSTRILEFVKQHKIDLIIITRTKISSRIEKQHYQSTVENIFRNSPCPILIL